MCWNVWSNVPTCEKTFQVTCPADSTHLCWLYPPLLTPPTSADSTHLCWLHPHLLTPPTSGTDIITRHILTTNDNKFITKILSSWNVYLDRNTSNLALVRTCLDRRNTSHMSSAPFNSHLNISDQLDRVERILFSIRHCWGHDSDLPTNRHRWKHFCTSWKFSPYWKLHTHRG